MEKKNPSKLDKNYIDFFFAQSHIDFDSTSTSLWVRFRKLCSSLYFLLKIVLLNMNNFQTDLFDS